MDPSSRHSSGCGQSHSYRRICRGIFKKYRDLSETPKTHLAPPPEYTHKHTHIYGIPKKEKKILEIPGASFSFKKEG